MPTPARLLGFAFAGADLLMELDDLWRVTYAAGAAPGPGLASEDLTARRLSEVLTPASADHLASVLGGLAAGRRAGPIDVRLQAGDGLVRHGELRAVMLPELAPRISCAVAYSGEPQAGRHVPDIADAEAFAANVRDALTASHAAGAPLSLALVHLAGMDDTQPAAGALVREIEELLQAASLDGSTAARVADQRYALLRRPDAPPEDLRASLGAIAARHDQRLEAIVSQAEVEPTVDPMASLRALRFTLDSFLQGRAQSDGALAMTFTGAVMRTLEDAAEFRSVVSNRRFDLLYQPIVKLSSGRVHHYEVLARFAPDASPAGVIRMAEELALITEFDLAVAERALKAMREEGPDLRLAVNVSGQSLESDRFTQALLAMTAADLGARPRLTLEVTESAALGDVGAANTRIQALRAAGFRVAIDDFGAGASSYDYLRSLSVDQVKIDGRYVREAATDARSQKLISHLVGLCRSLKLETVAEMIETEDVAALMRRLGVDCGQGWRFGRPFPSPRAAGESPAPARRRGAVDSWG